MNQILLIILLHQFGVHSSSYVLNKPIIVSENEELHLNASQNYFIECRGEGPMKWILPEVSALPKQWTHFESGNKKFLLNEKVMYNNTLYISNATYAWTGFYSCEYCEVIINTKQKVETIKGSSSIYIYIYDPDHLSASTSRAVIVDTNIERPIILPCRPTSTLIKVSLDCSNVTGYPIQCQEKPQTEFDPKVGFRSSNIPGPYVSCNYNYKGRNSKDIIILSERAVRLTDFCLQRYNPADFDSVSHTFRVLYSSLWLAPNNNGVITYTALNEKIHFFGLLCSSYCIYPYRSNRLTFYEKPVLDPYVMLINHHYKNNVNYLAFFSGRENFLEVQSHYKACKLTHESYENNVVQLIFNIKSGGKRPPQVTWFNNKNSEIRNSNKYSINTNISRTVLSIFRSDCTDSGLYKLEVQVDDLKRTNAIELNVVGRPAVKVNQHNKYHVIGSENKLKCIVISSPAANISWYNTPLVCTQDSKCTEQKTRMQDYTIKSLGNFTQESVLTITAEKSGYYICKAENYLGDAQDSTIFSVINRKEVIHLSSPMNLSQSGIIGKYKIATVEGQDLNLTCNVSKELHLKHITWNVNNYTISIDNRTKIEETEYPKTVSQNLFISKLNVNDSMVYSCNIEMHDEVVLQEFIEVSVKKSIVPKLVGTNLNSSKLEVHFANTLTLACEIEAFPQPQIQWSKDGLPLTNFTRIELRDNNQILYFPYVLNEDSGKYNCNATNQFGTVSNVITISVKKNTASIAYWIWIIIAICIVLFFATIFWCSVRIRKANKLKREIETLNLAKFETGTPEALNPYQELNTQAEFLPYDKKWDFPKNRLRFGRKLGSGAYGTVLEAEADSIIRGEKWTKVAVKMVNPNSDNASFRALISELKMFAHLGTHINIINLLGACTENLSRKELYVIFEYCRLGNALSYLRKHSTSFVDLIEQNTGKVIYANKSELIDYQAKSTIRNQNEKSNITSFNTKTLIEWSYQVCRAMEYLSSNKIFHGDLAARNILLADNNLVKICDFGLSRNLYNNANYKKHSKALLPIKWLAIETLQSHTFSIQSDVWSFGIVLWEFFSLGMTPYSDITNNQDLIKKLVDGYRMTSPKYATRILYGVMRDCWMQSPKLRPTFAILANILHNILQKIEEPSLQYEYYLQACEIYLHND